MKIRIEHDVVIRLSPELSAQVDKLIEVLSTGDTINTDALASALDKNEAVTTELEKTVVENQT